MAGPGIQNGESVGEAAAADIIALRINDGAEPNSGYPGPAKAGIGQYRVLRRQHLLQASINNGDR